MIVLNVLLLGLPVQSYFGYEKERQLQLTSVTGLGSSSIFVSVMGKKNPELSPLECTRSILREGGKYHT